MSDTLPDWHWRVICRLVDRGGEQVLTARAPTRAAAKRDVHDRVTSAGGTITEWKRTYIPAPSWDCPYCGTSEALVELPNLRGDHDWECRVCGLRAWGEPTNWDKFDTSILHYHGTPRGHLAGDTDA